MRATIAKVFLKNLEHNFNLIKKCVKPETKICVPVKADGYGHGAVVIAKECIKLGASHLAVATIEEGQELRAAGITVPILLLSIPQIDEIDDLIKCNLQPLVFEKQYIESLNAIAKSKNKKICVHLKIDTGMGRIGCKPIEAVDTAKLISQSDSLIFEGVCTHFAVSDSIKDEDIKFTKKQISIFSDVINRIKELGICPSIIHASASGGILMYPEAQFDMVRPGIIIYGYPPDQEQYEYLLKERILKEPLKPLMQLETKVSAIIHHSANETISYGRTWTTQNDFDTAVLPIGYADGLLRRFSPNLEVKINNTVYSVVGRICMDQCMVNLGKNHNVKTGDTVTIFSDGIDFQSAQDIAQRTGTISYEILCGINKRVHRIYIS